MKTAKALGLQGAWPPRRLASKALGLDVPTSILLSADELIE
jgi:hypothetical protein